MLEMIAALLRVLRRPPLSPVTTATPRDTKEFSSGKSSGLFGWFLGGGGEDESDNDLESEAYEAPVNEVSPENPATFVEHDGPLLMASWSTLCQHCPSLQASLKRKNPQLVQELITLSKDEMRRAGARPRPSARGPTAMTPPRQPITNIKEDAAVSGVIQRSDTSQESALPASKLPVEPAPTQVPVSLVHESEKAQAPMQPVANIPTPIVLVESKPELLSQSPTQCMVPNVSGGSRNVVSTTPHRRLPPGSIGVTVRSNTKFPLPSAAPNIGTVSEPDLLHPISDQELQPPSMETSSILPSPEQVPERPDAPLTKAEHHVAPLSLTSPVPLARFMGGAVVVASKSNDAIDVKKPLII